MKKVYFVFLFLLFIRTYSQNDLCSNAITITPSTTCNVVVGTFNGTTISSSAPNCATSASQDVWYSFVATERMIGITLYGTLGISNGFEVYENSCSGPIVICRNTNNAASSGENILYNNFTIGNTYLLRIFNAFTATSTNSFSFCVQSYPAPANDSCSNAITLTPNITCQSTNVNLSGSTLDGQSSTACSPNPSQDMWYKFVATDKVMSVSLSTSSTISNGYEIYQNNCAGNLVVCRNANGSGSGEFLSWSGFIIGETYYIRVLNEFTNPVNEQFSICVQNYPAPQNDICSNAISIPVNATCSTNTVALSGATLDGVSFASCSPNPSQDVWYKFIATSSNMTITISQAVDISNGFQVYENGCNGTLLICRNNNGNGQGETFTYNSFVVGNEYYIRVVNEYITPLTTSSFNLCVVDGTLSNMNFEEKNTLVYPNPVKDNVVVEIDAQFLDYIEVVNSIGQVVFKSKQNNFSLKELPNGLYWFIIKLKDSSKIRMHKIIKQ